MKKNIFLTKKEFFY
jgi:protein TIF31